jgi:hypothetical protein
MLIFSKDIILLLKEQLARLLKCSILPAQTYLAGGTAVYLYLGHRVSVDLDFFTQSYFNAEVFLSDAERCFDEVSVELLQKDTLILYVSQQKIDGLAKSRKCSLSVIPAKAGIQCSQALMKPLDPVFQQGDDFLRMHQFSISHGGFT